MLPKDEAVSSLPQAVFLVAFKSPLDFLLLSLHVLSPVSYLHPRWKPELVLLQAMPGLQNIEELHVSPDSCCHSLLRFVFCPGGTAAA